MEKLYSREKIDEIIEKYKRNYSSLSPEARKLLDKLISMREKLREADKRMLEQEKREKAAIERLEAAKKRYNYFNQQIRTTELLKDQRDTMLQGLEKPVSTRYLDIPQIKTAKQEAEMLLNALKRLDSQ